MSSALAPLRDREFRLVVLATLTSVLGDGMMRVALPLQVLAISGDDPLAMGTVGVAWALGHAASLPLGGVASDRRDRRGIMIASDLVRAVAIGAMGLFAVLGTLSLAQVVALGLSFGLANGFFNPAARSLVPDLIPEAQLARANALLGFARPLQLWIVGPLLGGALIALATPGVALLVDAGTFVVSALLLLRLRRRGPTVEPSGAGVVGQVREGLRYVSGTRWATVWFFASGLSTLAFHGPFDVLVPTMLKTDLGLSEAQAGWWMGMIFAAGGVGALVASSLIGQRDLPRRFLTTLYVVEGVSLLGLAGFAYLTRLWEALALGLVVFGAVVTAEIVAETNLQREVPRGLLGRVTSLEWFVAIGLAPISFALAGPLGRAFGPRPVLVTVGVTAGVAVMALGLAPGALTPQRRRMRRGGGSDGAVPDDRVPAGLAADAGFAQASAGNGGAG